MSAPDAVVHPPQVLLAIRSELLRDGLIDLIDSESYGVVVADNPYKAAEHCRVAHFDVLVLDTDFPEVQSSALGELIATSRSRNPYLRTILLCTVPPPTESLGRGTRLHNYLLKPLDPAWLLHSIASAAEVVEAERELERRAQAVEDAHDENAELRDRLAEMQSKTFLLEIAGSVTHELKNLLSVINVSAHFVRKKGSEQNLDPKLVKHLGVIGDQVARSQEQIVRFSQFLRGDEQVGRPTDVNAVIQLVLSLLDHGFNMQKISVRTDLRPELPSLVIQESSLRHILFNLLLNARDAMPDGGSLTIKTWLEGGVDRRPGVVALSVEDTGPGVPADIAEKVFEPFFTTKTSGTSTGLGLSISRRLAAAMGGELTLSPGTQSGARFVLMIPTAARGNAASANGRSSRGASRSDSGNGTSSDSPRSTSSSHPADLLPQTVPSEEK